MASGHSGQREFTPKPGGVVGLVGGIASGKSTAAAILQQLGAILVDADRLGHEALEKPEVVQALRERWGSEILTDQGHVDRAKVAQRVFGDGNEAELTFLEQTTHPIIGQLIEQFLQDHANTWVVVDAAVMMRAGWHDRCDAIIFVDSPLSARLARAQQRGWTAQQLHDRESSQTSLARKRRHAQFTVANHGSIDDLRAELCSVWRQLTGTDPVS